MNISPGNQAEEGPVKGKVEDKKKETEPGDKTDPEYDAEEEDKTGQIRIKKSLLIAALSDDKKQRD